ncbi:MAG: TauD/TfdA family dioxygenase [Burkholderiales bacterium]|nr:TauD/TfdA family dioxygenase [Burkholderiales bacterium]
MVVKVQPLHPLFAAEVVDVDVSKDLDDATFGQVQDAFNSNSVLLFRHQQLSPEQHVRFSRRFGPLEVHFLKQYLHPEHPELVNISNIIENGKPIGVVDAGQFWHSDLSYRDKPSRGSLLYAIEIPHLEGQALGDTLFTSTAAAYDALPDAMKRRLEGLKAIHRYGYRYEKHRQRGLNRAELTAEQKAAPDAIQPVIRTHPVTGRKCIYVNEGFTVGIVGMPDDESRPLLEQLFAHCVRPEFIYRHKWRVGDLLMWDNCATLHNAVGDYKPPHRRLLRKTTLEGATAF